MAILYVGSKKVVAGDEYHGLGGASNTMHPTEDVRISINHTPYSNYTPDEHISLSPEFTYSFETATVLKFSNQAVDDLNIFTVGYNTNDISLVLNVESASIVNVSDNIAITKGEISAFALVASTSNQDESVIIRIKGNTLGTIFTSGTITIPTLSNGTFCTLSNVISTTVPANELVTFTVEGTSSLLKIIGSDTASQLKLNRQNL